MQNVIVGTSGHVDHGKTCLIKALSGIDTDRLKEEPELYFFFSEKLKIGSDRCFG